MPELPEVEVIARGLRESMVGRTITRTEVPWPTSLRTPVDEFIKRTESQEIIDVSRRAKLLLVTLRSNDALCFHLKMTGRTVHGGPVVSEAHDRIRFALDDGTFLVFSDVRRFGYCKLMHWSELQEWDFYKNLGPEPLDSTPKQLVEQVEGRRARIKGLLLNQQIVAGVGNIYADETLYRAGIHPATLAADISNGKLLELFTHLREVLTQAIAENGSSISDYRDSGGNAGAFQNKFRVYGRSGEPCQGCKTPLKTVQIAGRTSTYCPACQRVK